MKKILLAIGCALMAGAIVAQPDRQVLTLTSTATNAGSPRSVTNSVLRGYIDSIQFDIPSAGVTTRFDVVVMPELSTLPQTTLASVSVCATDTVVRPRFYSTDILGGNPTNSAAYPMERFAVAGDSILFSITNASSTSLTFKAIIKYETAR